MASKSAELWLKIKTLGEEALERTANGLRAVGEVGAVAFAALAGLASKAIADFREQEKATNALTQAMVNNGVYSKELQQDYLAQASALQKLTTFGDEQIISAQAALQQQIGETKISKELTTAVLDLATAKGMDLTSAAELVGKSIGTSTNALARQGIEVDANASKQEKLAQVIEGLNSKFGGQAAAAGAGLGALDRLKNVVSDLSEEFGARLAPAVGFLSEKLIAFFSEAKNSESALNGLVGAISIISNAAVRLITVFGLAGDAIGISMAAVTNIVKAQADVVMAVFNKDFAKIPDLVATSFQVAKDSAIMGFDQMRAQLEERSTAMYDTLSGLDDAFQAKKAENDAAELARIDATLAAKAEKNLLHAQEQRALEVERKVTEQEENLAFQGLSEEQNLALQIQYLDKKYDAETKAKEKLRLLNEKSSVIKQLADVKAKNEEIERQKKYDEEYIRNRDSTLNTIATLQSSGNEALAIAGKAAALTEIAIQTPVAIARALALGPPIGYVAAAAVGVAMAAQAARVSGIKLAEGGIVPARPGGTSAIIGEAGQAEAVIPLDRMREFGMGGGGGHITLNVYGGLMGDEASAYQFLKVLDEGFLKLRRNNDSVAFDERVT